MAYILSLGTCPPPFTFTQESTVEFARELFSETYQDIDRLLKVFNNGEIENRNFAVPLEWFKEEHSFSEKNDEYINAAVSFGVQAIRDCLENTEFLKGKISEEQIDAIIFVSSTGVSTPSIDAKIMNKMSFSPHTKRIPIWGLGCAGGAAGFSRAYEYCKAFPDANVLVVAVELCGLTFQKNDHSKSNLIGTSLFADGMACALLCGEKSNLKNESTLPAVPKVCGTQSTLLPDSEDVMGWNIRDDGFFVVFSKDIPSLIKNWLKPNVEKFLEQMNIPLSTISNFVFHPGGKKVLQAYEKALDIPSNMTTISKDVLVDHGNMSSATVLYVLKRFMMKKIDSNEYGLMGALGPGFSSELLLLQWE